MSDLHVLLIFAGIPLLVILTVSLLVLAPGWVKGPRYRPGLPWTADAVWFGPAVSAVPKAAGDGLRCRSRGRGSHGGYVGQRGRPSRRSRLWGRGWGNSRGGIGRAHRTEHRRRECRVVRLSPTLSVMRSTRPWTRPSGLRLGFRRSTSAGSFQQRDPRVRRGAARPTSPEPARSVLVQVDPERRTLEIVTGEGVRRVLDNRAAGLAALSMQSAFAAGDLTRGLLAGRQQLGQLARGAEEPAHRHTPDAGPPG